MKAEATGPGNRTKGVRWLIWGGCLAVWTVALLTPFPIQAERRMLSEDAAFPTSKFLHVTGYAFLTGLSAWLGVAGRWRWALPGFLLFHGAATEYLQGFVPLRTGCWMDVGLNSAGVVLGLALTWPWWRRPDRGNMKAQVPGRQAFLGEQSRIDLRGGCVTSEERGP
jgi:hypothetical protein